MKQRKTEIGTRRDLVLYRLETAKNDLKSARALFAMEDYRGANNRAYYAIFHAINAVHAINGKAYKRHKDAVANFNKDYVKTSVFPREMGRKIGQAEEIRHASDYDDFYIASKEESSLFFVNGIFQKINNIFWNRNYSNGTRAFGCCEH